MKRARIVSGALVLAVLAFVAGPVYAQVAPPYPPARPAVPAPAPQPPVPAIAPVPPLPMEALEIGILGGVPGGIPGRVRGGVGWGPVGHPPFGEGPVGLPPLGSPRMFDAFGWDDPQDKPSSTITPEDEMKAMALNGLRNADPERAVPVLDRFLQADNALKLKARAISILSGFGTKEARAVVSRVAHDESNADLQMSALRALARFEGEESRKDLFSIYTASKNADVKKTIIRILAGQEDVPGVMSLLRAEADLDLKGFAIRQLGALQARDELRQLFTQEQQEAMRVQILRAMEAARDIPRIAEVARLEPVMAIRGEAIRRLSTQDRAESGKLLADLYANEKDMGLKKEILRGLARVGHIQALIAVARAEPDPELKRYAVEQLSRSSSKEASDFLVELLNK